MRFIATARDSCDSAEIEPKLIAPVQKRLTISLAGSTSSNGTADPATPLLNRSKPLSVQFARASSFACSAKRL